MFERLTNGVKKKRNSGCWPEDYGTCSPETDDCGPDYGTDCMPDCGPEDGSEDPY